jgi:hypothetical protein
MNDQTWSFVVKNIDQTFQVLETIFFTINLKVNHHCICGKHWLGLFPKTIFSISQHGVFILILYFWPIILGDLVLHHLSLKILIMHSKCLKQYSSYYTWNFITITYVENIVFHFKIWFFFLGRLFLPFFTLVCPFCLVLFCSSLVKTTMERQSWWQGNPHN